jgi:hypothetical protein
MTIQPQQFQKLRVCRQSDLIQLAITQPNLSWEKLYLVETLSDILRRHPDIASLVKACAAPTWEEAMPKAVKDFSVRGMFPMALPMQPEMWHELTVDCKAGILVGHLFRQMTSIKNSDDASEESHALRKSLFETASSLIQSVEDPEHRAELAEKLADFIVGGGTGEEF